MATKSIIGVCMGAYDFYVSYNFGSRGFAVGSCPLSSGGGDFSEGYEHWSPAVAGTLSALRMHFNQNTYTEGTAIVSRVNSGDGNLALSIGTGITGWLGDATHSDSISAGDALNYEIRPLDFLEHLALTAGLAQFLGSSAGSVGCWAWQSSNGEAGTAFAGNVASATAYVPLQGGGLFETSAAEADTQGLNRSPGTFSRLCTNVLGNASANAATLALRINGATCNEAISIGAGVTGTLQDTTHSDAAASGDLINCRGTTGSGQCALSVTLIGATLHGSSSAWTHRAAFGNSGSFETQGYAAGTTYYLQPCGQLANASSGYAVNASTAEADGQWKIPFDCYFSMLSARVRLATGESTATPMHSRVNGANGNLALSMAANTTGTFEDISHWDALSAGDKSCISLAAQTSTNRTYTFVGLRGDVVAPSS